MGRLNKTDAVLIASFLALVALPALYAVRFLDDNRLTSWQWIFEGRGALTIFAISAAGVLLGLLTLRMPARGGRRPVLLFLASFLAIVPLWRGPEVILDAGRYFLQAKSLAQNGFAFFFTEWGGEISAWTDLPLVPFLFGTLFALLGESRLVIQFLTTILFAATTVLTCRIGETLWDEDTGLLAGILLLGSPYLLMQVPLMLVDVPAMFFLTFAIFTVLQALRTGGHARIALASAAVALALFAKYSLWPMLAVLPVIAVLSAKQGEEAAFRRSALVAAGALLLVAPVILLLHQVIVDQIGLLASYQLPGLGRWKESSVSTFLFQTHPFLLLFALAGVVAAIRRKDIRFLVPAWFALFVLGSQIGRMRYLLPLFPLFAIMAAYGLRMVRERPVRQFIATCAAATSFLIAVFVYAPFFARTSMVNLQHAGRYLNSLDADSVVVHPLPQHESTGSTAAAIPLLDLYTSKRILVEPVGRREALSAPQLTSSLRFSWEMKLPAFYAHAKAESSAAVVVIASESGGPLSRRRMRNGGLSPATKPFMIDNNVFKYRTIVTVFRGGPLAGFAQAREGRCADRDSTGL